MALPIASLPADAGPRPKPAELASADIYLDVVHPALDRRCLNCHNNSKKSGRLSMATYETMMKGGSKGAVIIPGKPCTSDLFRRVNLAPSRSDFMSKEGKTLPVPMRSCNEASRLHHVSRRRGGVGQLQCAR
jgi:hypothetical protein